MSHTINDVKLLNQHSLHKMLPEQGLGYYWMRIKTIKRTCVHKHIKDNLPSQKCVLISSIGSFYGISTLRNHIQVICKVMNAEFVL